MLSRLTIQSFALIDSIELEFSTGFTVFLGETGAGKSVIIDALAAALGERSSADLVKQGAKKALVEAEFIDPREELQTFLHLHDLQWEASEIIVRREILSSGTSRCFVNDTPTNVSVVKELASLLIDFHGQHDTHGLLSMRTHKGLLDTRAGNSALLARMKQAWMRYTDTVREHSAIVTKVQHADAERHRLSFLHDEIAAIDPQPQEDDVVAQELRRMESSEVIVSTAIRLRDALYAADQSAYDRLRESRDLLRELVPFDGSLQDCLKDVESALIICKELAGIVAPFADVDAMSPERLEHLRQRSAQLQRLIKKYGSIDASREHWKQYASELEQLEHADETVQAAESAMKVAFSDAEQLAVELHTARIEHAPAFAKAIESSLHEMGMAASAVRVDMRPLTLGPTGSDEVELLLSSNAGEPPRSLSKVASGGELSRVMLSIKRALTVNATFGTMVFDEIDTGISGKVARKVGTVMKDLSSRQQIICITHLPQIASLANAFVHVSKHIDKSGTTISAQAISIDSATTEIAKLLSGSDVTSSAIEGAKELMQHTATPVQARKRQTTS